MPKLKMTGAETVAFLIERDGDVCQWPSGCEFEWDEKNHIRTIDHRYPKFLARQEGWTAEEIDHIDNLQLMCKFHNTIKGHQLPDDEGKFQITRREPKPIRAPRPEICDLCLSGRILLIGEVCPVCESGPQPLKYPGSLQRKPKECDHSTHHCWRCVVDDPSLRVPAIQRIAFGP
jgi:hypothetical protein